MTAAFDEEGRPLPEQEYPADTAEAGNFSSGEKLSALLFMLEDLERSRQQIEHVNREWIASMDAIADPVFLHDREFRILRCNRAYQQRAGMPFKQIIGRPYYEVFPKSHEPMPCCLRAMEKAEEEEEEVVVGETVYRSRTFSIHGEQGGYLYSVHILEDITESRRAEAALRESEKLYRSLFDNMLNGFAYCQMLFEQDRPQDFSYLSVNAAFETQTGLKNATGRRASEVIPGIRQSDPELFEIYGRVSLSGKPERFEIYVEALQQWFWISVYSPAKGYFVSVFDVITERKRNELALLKLNRAFRTLSAGNHELVHATGESDLLQAMCRVAVEIGGYSAAWVGYRQNDAEKSIRPMAQCGFEPEYADTMRISWADNERGRGPSGKVVRSGMTQVVQDVASDPDCAPWREQALQHGHASAIALPLSGDAGVFGVLTIYVAEANTFDKDEIALLEEMAGDLSFGIRMLRLRQEQQHHAEQIRRGLEGTVQAVATMVEMRDPYTAGHQRRVAQLAAAIATEMGLPEEQVHGIHLAGTIHDLGKIQVPAEILSKPGRLSAIEFSLIKEHARNGYEILKDVEFPWPIAQMVLQHHERLNGSGYPQGLKGDAILLEARILAVADTVEAISAHRPYRPGLGVEVALTEISKGRGTHYDPDAVDACIRLFREKGYKF